MREVRHDDPNAALPPRIDGKKPNLELWSALMLRAGELLEKNEKEDAAA